MIQPKKCFDVSISAGSMNRQEFRRIVAAECNKIYNGAGELILNPVALGFSELNIDWNILMGLKTTPKCKKSAKQNMNDDKTFIQWMRYVVDLGMDHTSAALEISMQNPATKAKQRKVAAAFQNHMLTQQAAIQASGSSSQGSNDVPPVRDLVPGNFQAQNVVMNQIYANHLLW
ncbi:hypothetical protein PTTG_04352 [Puccinia triticina 1-1 BBBD Race 1]|uniref:Uncharacterized protein n=1 Tax=Puccinia triticina (isolate 1-1 / race 1 (BBBD)) TaxID=630390 RepID=A0A0C4EU73_PUCT1|nr:hypothetical protein PTTG_04352 [Puccinia triticina 1-1 BBBD Race 1]